jgi:RNA polymerase sigma factor (sigma-70 family)
LSEKQAIYYELLVLRCRRQQKSALEELIRMWERPLFYYIRRLVDDEQDAWQILQETWLKVLRGIRKLNQPQKLPSWLYRIARNTAISHLRSKYTRQAHSGRLKQNANLRDIEDRPDNLAFENAEQVHYGLGRISLHHREVLTLFFLQDLSVEEIAEVLEIPAGTVKSRLNYAKRALKAVLEEESSKHE